MHAELTFLGVINTLFLSPTTCMQNVQMRNNFQPKYWLNSRIHESTLLTNSDNPLMHAELTFLGVINTLFLSPRGAVKIVDPSMTCPTKS